jgi:hypothetical protein
VENRTRHAQGSLWRFERRPTSCAYGVGVDFLKPKDEPGRRHQSEFRSRCSLSDDADRRLNQLALGAEELLSDVESALHQGIEIGHRYEAGQPRRERGGDLCKRRKHGKTDGLCRLN